jgi:hypothetical protein
MSVSITRKVELVVEANNDVYPEEIDEDITFVYAKMYDGKHAINQTTFKVIKCDVKDVI